MHDESSMYHSNPKEHKMQKREKFSKEEDEQLMELVDQMGDNKWIEISRILKTRSARQCRDRWKNYLDPNLTHQEWSQDDDSLLMKKYELYGPSWKKISKAFPTRSVSGVRNRVLKLSRKTNDTIRTTQSTSSSHEEEKKEETFNILLGNESLLYLPEPEKYKNLFMEREFTNGGFWFVSI